MTPRRPNVLLIMSDQHRGDCLDFAARGEPAAREMRVQTPHLRRLAESGAYFPRCYSEAPVCVPARAVLQTGQHPMRSGVVNNAGRLPEDVPTVAGALAAEGYFCQGIGKMHFAPVRAHHGLHRLWLSEEMPGRLEDDEFLQFLVASGYGHVHEPNGNRQLYMLPQVSQLPETHHTTAWTGRQTVAFLREQQRERPGQPFFCWTSFQKPHPPFEPPVPWHRMYSHGDAPTVEKSEEELAWLPATLRRFGVERMRERFPDPDTLALCWAYYFAAISFIDAWIGVILDELERSGQHENTLVIYTADHGELFGDHWAAGKDCFYEGAARVPLIVSWQGHVPAGVRRGQLAGLTDVVPTILGAVGCDAAAHRLEPDGVDLRAVACDETPTRDIWLGQVGRGPSAHVAAITDEWKYVYEAGGGRELLFRYREARGELRDLAEGEAEVTRELREYVQAALENGASASSELLARAEASGYRHFEPPAGGVPIEDSHWLRRAQYPGWVSALPEDWCPPSARETLPAEGPRTPDRSAYHWAPLTQSASGS